MDQPGARRLALIANGGPVAARWRPTGPLTQPPRSILVVMMSALGDAVQVLPVAGALRRTFPRTRITWVIQPGPHGLVAGHPWVDEFILFHRGDRARTPGRLMEGGRAIRRTVQEIRAAAGRMPGGQFDLLLSLQVYFKAGIITALSPARIKLGFDRARARDMNHLFTTHRIPPHPSGCAHIQDQYFEFLDSIGVNPHPVEYGLRLTRAEEEAKEEFFSRLDRPACAVVLATSDPRKNWTAEGYAALVRAVWDRFGLQPVLVGGESDAERSMAREIQTRAGHLVLDARKDDLRRLLWLLAGSALAVSPDTGPLHVARALGVPVVGLYGFTNPKRYGPYQKVQEWVVDGYARFSGEAYPVSTERRADGMGRITVERVLEKMEEILATASSTGQGSVSGSSSSGSPS